METKRYWQIQDTQTNECFLGLPMDELPEPPYVEFQEGVNDSFIKPTMLIEEGSDPVVIEGVTPDDIAKKIEDLRIEYDDLIDAWLNTPPRRGHYQKFLIEGIAMPSYITEERARLRQEFHDKVEALTGTGQEHKPKPEKK
jgi:hypothetical protein